MFQTVVAKTAVFFIAGCKALALTAVKYYGGIFAGQITDFSVCNPLKISILTGLFSWKKIIKKNAIASFCAPLRRFAKKARYPYFFLLFFPKWIVV